MRICFSFIWFLPLKGLETTSNGRDANGNGDPPDDVADDDEDGDRRIKDDRTATLINDIDGSGKRSKLTLSLHGNN